MLRARAAGRRRDPVRRPDAAQARARDRGRRLPDPRHAVRGDRPRRGPRALRRARSPSSAIRCPAWGIARTADEAVDARATRIGYPVLVRPSYVLGGRAMRVCYDDATRCAQAIARARGPGARRPLPRERDRDRRRRALRRRGDVHRRRHAARRGGGRPLRRLGVRAAGAVAHRGGGARGRATSCGGSGRALGVVGLLNVQLAIADGEVYVLEVEPARVAHGAVREQGDRRRTSSTPPAGSRPGGSSRELGLPRERPPAQVSVKAAVLPFARFPGADPVLGPEMRSTGEVMASAADLPTAFAKAERAAGRPLPTSGTAFLSVRDADKPPLVPVAAALAGLGFELVATDGHRATRSRAPGSRRARREGRRGRRRRDGRRPRSAAAAATSSSTRPQGRGARSGRLPDPRGRARRARAVHHDDLRRRRGRARDRERARARSALSLQERIDASKRERALASVARPSAVGPYTLLASSAAASTRDARASSSCSRRPGACCRGR